MELQTVVQVSRTLGISAQMLRYYERNGLIKSSRKDDYAYRVYDEDAIKRLQLIVILRKLQIPVKQIRDILNNQDAVTVIEVFRRNMSELDERITALSTVRSILSQFVEEIQQKADIRLKLDLLNDTTMLAVVDSLSFPENKIKENISMDELNRASEQLNKQAEKNVRIVYRPPSAIARFNLREKGIVWIPGKGRVTVEAAAKKFIEDTDLFKLKPDLKVFGFDSGDDMETIWISIPDDLEVSPPWKKEWYHGGLYAACRDSNFDVYQWVQDSDDYEWDISQGPGGEEYFNPFNIYGLENGNPDKAMYTEYMCPVKETGKLTEVQKKAADAALEKMDKAASRGETVEIDLTAMELQQKDGQIYELNYPNGLIELKVENMYHSGNMLIPRSFNLPLKIETRVKTDKSDIHIGCSLVVVQLEWNFSPTSQDTLCIYDQTDGSLNTYKKFGHVPVNEFVDIECFFCKDAVAVRVNGELRHYGTDYPYMKKFAENPGYNMLGNFFVGPDCGSTITIESLRVTEL